MAFIGTGHHHFRFHAFDGISRKMRLTWLRSAAALMCLMALVAAMWVGGNPSALVHTSLMSEISLLGTVMILARTSMALSLIGLIGAGFFQLRMEQVDALVTWDAHASYAQRRPRPLFLFARHDHTP